MSKVDVNYKNNKFYRKGINRVLTVYKKSNASAEGNPSTYIPMVRNSRQQIQSFLQKFPLNVKEKQELQQRTERTHINEGYNCTAHFIY